MKKLLICAALMGCGLAVSAQERDLTLEDVTENYPVKTVYLSQTEWLEDGDGYAKIEFNEEAGGYDIVRYEAKDGKRSVLVPAERMIDPATGKPIGVYSFQWSDDNSKILIFNNTRKVWRYHTRGDYWVLDLKTGTLRQIGSDRPEASLMFAKFSPDGTKVAYVSENNIYAEDIDTGKTVQLTYDGSDNIINGTFDWVYEEEFNSRDGFRWSPDSRYIAYWNSDTDGTGTFYMINNTDSIYSRPIPLPYPKAGTANSAVKIGYVPAEGGATVWIDVPGDPRNNYLPRMEFIPGEDELLIQQMNRSQNTNKVWTYDIATGKLENIFTDRDDAWLETNDNIQWTKGNEWFTWESDRNGWKQIYFISRDGKKIKPITNGTFDVVSQEGIDLKNGYIYYITSLDDYTQRYLYRSKLNGKGAPELISPADQRGFHSYNRSPTARWAVHQFSSASQPPVYDMVLLPNGKSVRILEDNEKAKETYDSFGFNDKEFVKVDIGDVVLDAWIIKPKNFDPALKYPVIVEVYGEPGTSMVADRWRGGDLWQQYLANLGYIVVSIDNRGVGLPRGREWRKCIYGKVGVLAAQDQADAVNKMLDTYDYMDRDRVGVNGWSGGGSMTLHAMFRFPELYKTGIAIAFVADQRLYDTIYQERYMDTPQNNAEGYRISAPINYAGGLEGNLLLIHGTGDDNVHYQNFELLVNELIRLKKPFSTMVYPNRSHSIDEGENTTYHFRMTQADYWLKNLPAGGVKR